mgnify:CR=1 FL=1
MKNWFKRAIILCMQLTFIDESFAQEAIAPGFKWEQLPQIPDAVGFAGSFAGVSNGVLLVAGGANFPDGGAPWKGSVKKWYDQIFALEKDGKQWKEVGKLPRSLGYGVSISWDNGLVCIGGSNESGHYADAYIIRYEKDKVSIEDLPSMPRPIANTCGALVGDKVYVAGGTESPDSKSSENIFWCLDLAQKGAARKWEMLESWPGPSRILSVAGSQQGAFYLFSGAQLKDGQREYLKDAFKFDPEKGWSKIADLPTPVVAAPATAYACGEDHLFIFGGDNGKDAALASQLKEKHPGFSTDILAYDVIDNEWRVSGQIKTDIKNTSQADPNGSTWAPVTTPLVVWNGKIVLPGGEIRPATRTPRVLIATPRTNF